MDQLLRELEALRTSGEKAVLASIIRVQGSAYRREGAKMLFFPDGRQRGTLSAGCLESDLSFRAEAVQQSGYPLYVSYDMSSDDDFTWGRGSGCNGRIDVFVEPVCFGLGTDAEQSLAVYWNAVLSAVQRHESVYTLRGFRGAFEANPVSSEPAVVTPSELPVYRIHVGQSQDSLLTVGDVEPFISAQFDKFCKEGTKNQSLTMDARLWTMDHIAPDTRLFVFGAGPDAVPMVEAVAQAGFDVTVIDPRTARLTKELFPRASQLVLCHPEQAESRLDIPRGSYALVMTHSFQSDRTWVEYLAELDIAYLGVLGPHARTVRLFGTKPLPPFVKSPIGLDIGADGPEEIAASVAAELILRKRKGLLS